MPHTLVPAAAPTSCTDGTLASFSLREVCFFAGTAAAQLTWARSWSREAGLAKTRTHVDIRSACRSPPPVYRRPVPRRPVARAPSGQGDKGPLLAGQWLEARRVPLPVLPPLLQGPGRDLARCLAPTAGPRPAPLRCGYPAPTTISRSPPSTDASFGTASR